MKDNIYVLFIWNPFAPRKWTGRTNHRVAVLEKIPHCDLHFSWDNFPFTKAKCIEQNHDMAMFEKTIHCKMHAYHISISLVIIIFSCLLTQIMHVRHTINLIDNNDVL